MRFGDAVRDAAEGQVAAELGVPVEAVRFVELWRSPGADVVYRPGVDLLATGSWRLCRRPRAPRGAAAARTAGLLGADLRGAEVLAGWLPVSRAWAARLSPEGRRVAWRVAALLAERA